MDTETKQLLQRFTDRLDELKGVKDAVGQLEEQMKAVPASIDKKLAAIRTASWDDRGRYRGVFASEDDARCFGLYVMASVGGDTTARDALAGEMKSVFERAMGSDQQSTGGGLVPIEYSARIERLVESFGVYARNAFTMPMTTDQMTFQRRTSGFTVYKTGQNTAANATDLGFGTINLNADEWNVLTVYPKTIGEDASAAVGELIAIEIGQAFGYTIDYAGFVGDGTPDTPNLDVFGITTRLATINGVDDGGGLVLGSGNTGDKWTGLVKDDFLKVMGQVQHINGAMNKWFVSNPFFWQVMAPIQTDGGGNTVMNLAEGPQLQFMGAQVEIAQVMPKTGGDSQVCALFGDLKLSSTHGRRQELTIDQSRDVKFIERQVAVLGTQRHAINNHSLGDAANAGPVVGLITPAA